MILTATQTPQPDYVALAMVLALAVVVAIMAIRKRFFIKTKASNLAAATVPVPTRPDRSSGSGCCARFCRTD